MTSSDDEGQNENPMVTRHRKEKKELRAKMLALKKAAKSGNKQKQKEVNAECDKMEKEQDERHKAELAADLVAPPPTVEATPTSSEAPPTTTDDVTTDGEDADLSSKFYKNVQISSKKAKAQAKKKEQSDKLKAAQAADKEASRRADTERALEKAAIKGLLVEDHLKMIEIPADGDCMYSAISHQLQEESIDLSSRKLRKAVALYMREHKEDFREYVADSDTEDQKKKAKGAESSDDPVWEQYLFGVEQCSETGGEWGGQLELKAISDKFQRVVMVYKEEGRMRIGEEKFGHLNARPLRVVYLRKAFTLGEHYNSTCVY